jgi:hypothetical protein
MHPYIYNKWYPIPNNQVPIPVNETLRIWVKMLNGSELELHAQYLGKEHGWDLPLGLKRNILTIEAFQRIEKPHWKLQNPRPSIEESSITIELPEPGTQSEVPPQAKLPQAKEGTDPLLANEPHYNKINPDPLKEPAGMQMEHNFRGHEPSAELQVFTTYPEVKIECTLSTKYKILMYRERGEVPSVSEEITLINENEIKKMRPETREALLWIWAENGNKTIKVGEQSRKLTVEEIEDIIIAIGQKIMTDKSNEIKQAYQELMNWPDQPSPEQVYTYVGEIIRLGELIRKYGDSTTRALWRAKLAGIEACYVALRREWIEKYGSEELKYAQKTQRPEVEYLYAQERLSVELPGFQLVRQEDIDKIIPKERPNKEEIRLAMNFPNAIIVNITENRNNCNEYVTNTYILMHNYLGQYQIMISIDDAMKLMQNREKQKQMEPPAQDLNNKAQKAKEVPADLNGKGTMADEKHKQQEQPQPQESPQPPTVQVDEPKSTPPAHEPPTQAASIPTPRRNNEWRTGFLNNLGRGNPNKQPPPKMLLDEE